MPIAAWDDEEEGAQLGRTVVQVTARTATDAEAAATATSARAIASSAKDIEVVSTAVPRRTIE